MSACVNPDTPVSLLCGFVWARQRVSPSVVTECRQRVSSTSVVVPYRLEFTRVCTFGLWFWVAGVGPSSVECRVSRVVVASHDPLFTRVCTFGLWNRCARAFHVFRPVMPTVLTPHRSSGGLRPAGFALVGVLVGCFRASLRLVVSGRGSVCGCSWVSLWLVIDWSWVSCCLWLRACVRVRVVFGLVWG